MNCESATKNLSLFLYGELSIEDEQSLQEHLDGCAACRRALESEKAIHRALYEREKEPPAALLAHCRRDLSLRLDLAASARKGWRAWLGPWPAWARPVGAVALVALGFFGARWTAPAFRGPVANAEPLATRIRYLQPEASGQVRLVLEETRERLLTGDPNNDQIRRLLLAAARESSDAGLRAESMGLLRARPASNELRNTLVYALEHDPNPGVRLKALDGLKSYAGEPEVRSALAKVLLADDNPGVRTQAIDLLVQKKEDDIVGLLQELVQRESNSYVRLRCQKALQEMDASVGTF
jgi:hypothetical protein